MNKHLKDFISKKFENPGKALDLGAGDFSDVNSLKELGWECEGVDIKTGVNLEEPYLSEKRPFDLVYSNYLLQKLKNKKELIKTAYDNLRKRGWFFIHTFDKTDFNSNSDITKKSLYKMLEGQGFKDIKIKLFDFFDEDHNHWHKILEAVCQK